MEMIITAITGAGALTANGLLIRFLWSRMAKMEKDQKEKDKIRKLELYQPGGQMNYVLRKEHNDHCKEVQQTFCKKVDETKELITDMKTIMERMETTREKDKEAYHVGQREIFERLAGIEAK